MGAAPILTISKNGETIKSQSVEGEVMLGRSEGCVIRLEDRAISRQHAVFRQTPDGVQVEKKSEFAPLSVNGAECTRAFVKEGDVISIGPYLLKLSNPEGQSDVTAPVAEPSVIGELPPMPEIGLTEPPSEIVPEAVQLAPAEPAVQEVGLEKAEEQSVPSFSPPNFGMGEQQPDNSHPIDLGAIQVDEDAKTKIVSSAQVSAKLVFSTGAANVTDYEITKDEISIGRGKDCDIILDDKKASRKHAIVRRAGVNFSVKDLNSANGIYLNGSKVSADGEELSGDDILKIGNTEFRFLVLSSEYAEKQDHFLSVPEELSLEEEAPQEEIQQIQQPQQFQQSEPLHQESTPNAPFYQNSAAGINSISPGIAGMGAKKQTLLEKYKALPPRRKIIWTVVILAALYFAFFDEESPQKAVKPKTAVTAKDAKTVATFDSLTPEQKKFVEAQHALAFDYYKNKDYDKALFEIQKIFELIPDYKESREIERYAKEGKRTLEAQEEEKRKKEEEEKLKLRISELVDVAKGLMDKHKYDEALEIFPQVLALDPDNQQIADWHKIVEQFQEDKRMQDQQKSVQAQINARAWDLYKEGVALKNEKKFRDAIDVFQKVPEIGATDKRPERQARARIADIQKMIADLRDPVLAEAKQHEDAQEYPKAYELYQHSTEIDPSYPAGFAGMDRIRGILHERAKALYIEAVLAESYTDFETAKKKFQDCKNVAPKDDIYYERAERKLAAFFKAGEEVTQ